MGSEQEYHFDVEAQAEVPERVDSGHRRIVAEPASITQTVRELYISARAQQAEVKRKMCVNRDWAAKMFIKDFWPVFGALYSLTEPFIEETEIREFQKGVDALESQIMAAAPDVLSGAITTDFWPTIEVSLSFFAKYARLLADKNLISMQ